MSKLGCEILKSKLTLQSHVLPNKFVYYLFCKLNKKTNKLQKFEKWQLSVEHLK